MSRSPLAEMAAGAARSPRGLVSLMLGSEATRNTFRFRHTLKLLVGRVAQMGAVAGC